MLPADWRRRNKVGPSTEMLLSEAEDGSLRLETREQAVARAQALVRRYIPENVSLVDELLAERRAEAASE